MSNTGVISIGVKTPIIRQGDDLKNIIIASISNVLYENGMKMKDGDVIGITESIVARAQGNYVTIDDIVQFMTEHNFKKKLALHSPIMSRNRFSMILKAFARYADEIAIIPYDFYDEVGNPIGVNPFTGVNVPAYYEELAKSENCHLYIDTGRVTGPYRYYFENEYTNINCKCHPNDKDDVKFTLAQVMNEPVTRADGSVSGFNADWGLLGSNKANEETLKLFPQKDKAQELVDSIQDYYANAYGYAVNVFVFGDGCFKSPEVDGVSIWEFADPVTCPAYTHGIEGTPNEIKLKAFADDEFKDLSGEELEEAIKNEINTHRHEDLVGNMTSQGTTPRQVTDLLASLSDLTTASGDKGTPVTLIKNYFNKYCD